MEKLTIVTEPCVILERALISQLEMEVLRVIFSYFQKVVCYISSTNAFLEMKDLSSELMFNFHFTSTMNLLRDFSRRVEKQAKGVLKKC